MASVQGHDFMHTMILFFLFLQVLDGQESNGFEQLVESLKYHRCVITVYHLFLFISLILTQITAYIFIFCISFPISDYGLPVSVIIPCQLIPNFWHTNAICS